MAPGGGRHRGWRVAGGGNRGSLRAKRCGSAAAKRPSLALPRRSAAGPALAPRRPCDGQGRNVPGKAGRGARAPRSPPRRPPSPRHSPITTAAAVLSRSQFFLRKPGQLHPFLLAFAIAGATEAGGSEGRQAWVSPRVRSRDERHRRAACAAVRLRRGGRDVTPHLATREPAPPPAPLHALRPPAPPRTRCLPARPAGPPGLAGRRVPLVAGPACPAGPLPGALRLSDPTIPRTQSRARGGRGQGGPCQKLRAGGPWLVGCHGETPLTRLASLLLCPLCRAAGFGAKDTWKAAPRHG